MAMFYMLVTLVYMFVKSYQTMLKMGHFCCMKIISIKLIFKWKQMKDCLNMFFKGKDILKPERKRKSENYLIYKSNDFRKMCGICNMMQEHMASMKVGV